MIPLAVALLAASPAVAASPAAGSSPAEAAPWCARAEALAAEGADDMHKLDEVLALLPADAAPVTARARELAGDEGSLGRSWEVVGGALRDGCAPRPREGDPAAEVAGIMARDPRFGGVRTGDDLIDRIEHRVQAWLASLFESAGLRAYATSARLVYLSLLAVVVLLVAVRLARNFRRTKKARAAARTAAAVIRERTRAFAAWREQAQRALDGGDARGALRAGEAALLARVGELDARAVTPARTHREILRRLRADVADTVRPALASFDAMFFGKPAALDDAFAFLRSVDDAARRLAAAEGAA